MFARLPFDSSNPRPPDHTQRARRPIGSVARCTRVGIRTIGFQRGGKSGLNPYLTPLPLPYNLAGPGRTWTHGIGDEGMEGGLSQGSEWRDPERGFFFPRDNQ